MMVSQFLILTRILFYLNNIQYSYYIILICVINYRGVYTVFQFMYYIYIFVTRFYFLFNNIYIYIIFGL